MGLLRGLGPIVWIRWVLVMVCGTPKGWGGETRGNCSWLEEWD
jgi:hypothetical protein